MFDIFWYLFENYQPEACPEPQVLALKLSAAGFNDKAIKDALTWLEGLAVEESANRAAQAGANAFRVYDVREELKLSVEARGFLTFLEHAGALDQRLRETAIERAMALSDQVVSVDKLKVIVLMVLWRRHEPLDILVLEELLAAEGDELEAPA